MSRQLRLKRIGRLGGCLTSIAALILAAIAIFTFRDHSLLERAVRIAPCPQDACDYSWLDRSHCLVIAGSHPATGKGPLQISASIVDIDRRSTRALPALASAVQQQHEVPRVIYPSPISSFIAWSNWDTAIGTHYMANLDGTAFHHVASAQFSELFWADERYLVVYISTNPSKLLIHDPRRIEPDRTIGVDSAEALRMIKARDQVASGGQPYQYTQDPIWQPGDSHFKIEAISLPGDLKPADKQTHTYSIKMPPGNTMVDPRFDVQTGRALWVITTSQIPPPSKIDQLMRFVIPSYHTHPVTRTTLWVSNLNGSSMRELGHIACHAGAPDGLIHIKFGNSVPNRLSVVERVEPEMYDSQNAPDGRHISFGYDGSLYVLAVPPLATKMLRR